MRIGLQLPEVERPYRWTEVRDIARAAEDVGFESLWVGDHLLYRDDGGARGPWEAWSVLAALGEATERVRLGPLVAATAFHNPAMLAKKAATVDEISGGRLVVGLGAGWNAAEFAAFGFPYDRRASRFEEAFTIVHTLLRNGRIDFDGEFHTLRDIELVPPARPGIPVLIGSNGPRVLRATLPHVDAWNTWYASYENDPVALEPLVDLVDGICREVGRDPSEVERTAAVYVQAPGGTGRAGGRGIDPTTPIAGSTDEVAEQLSAFATAGMGTIQVVLDPIERTSVEWMGEVLRIASATWNN